MRRLLARPGALFSVVTALNVLPFIDRFLIVQERGCATGLAPALSGAMFPGGGVAAPLTQAVAWAMMPGPLAMACLLRAAARASCASARELPAFARIAP